jgi:DNA-binding transcriptional ArsR family regulator
VADAASGDSDRVGSVLGALADPTRRAVFEAVARDGPVTATDLAGRFPVSRQAIAKHLDRLSTAGLVDSTRVGRETRWTASLAPLGEARRWFDDVGAAWDHRLAALARQLRGGDATDRANR